MSKQNKGKGLKLLFQVRKKTKTNKTVQFSDNLFVKSES